MCSLFDLPPVRLIAITWCAFATASAYAQSTPAPSLQYKPYRITTYVGYSPWGSYDGQGAAAQFQTPKGLAHGPDGSIYVADSKNHTIRKVTPDGMVTTVAGKPGIPGSADGVGADARFQTPMAVAADAHGNLYVSDLENYTIRVITPAGAVSTLAGSAGVSGNTDGVGPAARFGGVFALAVDATGNVYAADFANNAVRKIAIDGTVTTILHNAPDQLSGLKNVTSVAVDAYGNVWTAVADGPRWDLYKLTPAGTLTLVTTVAVKILIPRFTQLFNVQIAVSPDGTVYAADNLDSEIDAITADGTVSTLFRETSPFEKPVGITVDATGRVYFSSDTNVIYRLAADGTPEVFAGSINTLGFSGADGTGRSARLAAPWGVAVDAQGVTYVAEESGAAVRKIAPGGVVTTLAGWVGHVGGAVDDVGAAARFGALYGLALASDGTIYVADADNMAIRRVTADGTVTTWAGTMGVTGSLDGIGNQARFERPIGIAIDPGGTLYVADYNANTIRKISPDRVVTTIAGLADSAGSADGRGPAARFNHPKGIAIDNDGNLLVSDYKNCTIRKMTPDGVVTTFAGVPGEAGLVDGDLAKARFQYLGSLAFDRRGNLYVGDGNLIRRIDANGRVTTLAGSPTTFSSYDGVGADAAFASPASIAVDADGRLIIADYFNNEIRIGIPATAPTIAAQPQNATLAGGTTTTLSVTATEANSYQWMINGAPIDGATDSTYHAAYAGTYSVAVSNAGGTTSSASAVVTTSTSVVNLSSRALTQSGDGTTIAGFVIAGAPGSRKQVLIRAVGPTLTQFGVGNAVASPVLSLYDHDGHLIASDRGWMNSIAKGDSALSAAVQPATIEQMASVRSFALPANSADSALSAALPPGTYTAIVSTTGSPGVGLAEIYELTTGDGAMLSNISTRATVGNAEDVLITGFVVTGTQPLRLLLRGVGPTLASFAVSSAIQKPELSLYDSQGKLIARNSGWSLPTIHGDSPVSAMIESVTVAAVQSTGAFPLPPQSRDAAFFVTLPPGNYTAHLSNTDNITGTGLIEAYVAPAN
jgi:sugar lactone lactonase YvrE